VELLGRQLAAPLLFCFFYLICAHVNRPLSSCIISHNYDSRRDAEAQRKETSEKPWCRKNME
jgi:hypothetical protein